MSIEMSSRSLMSQRYARVRVSFVRKRPRISSTTKVSLCK